MFVQSSVCLFVPLIHHWLTVQWEGVVCLLADGWGKAYRMGALLQ